MPGEERHFVVSLGNGSFVSESPSVRRLWTLNARLFPAGASTVEKKEFDTSDNSKC